MNYLIIIIPTLILIPFFLFMERKIKITKHSKHVRNLWDEILILIDKRRDILPYLLETLKEIAPEEDKLFQVAVQCRGEASFINPTPTVCGPQEERLSKVILAIINYGKNNSRLKKDPRFLEIKKELIDLTMAVKAAAKKYNDAVKISPKNSSSNLNLGIFSYLNC